ncbi:Cobyric acid synthase [Sedimentisphaera cyanobacteriorum]|uniref:Cobyric acid synthase n=1 Tax=Sedimentisphaera cyanobacteriorum TaxID=1940790 RepID=A0A1Q2HRM9_9BACT|nr:cobyric acid synthase [Sedimentisphaera cyanobacteriorum]AQQ09883.1 Cobyric acid synthase [Sedimentisphaera cyanobacteriorum]
MKTFGKKAKCISILGTGSDVGKSIVATTLCRILSDRGLKVAPFKAQNMSNNSFVTKSGHEIGRAQIVQAQAARVEATADMNPVLLKPCTDTGAQIVLHGKPFGNCLASDYFADTNFLFGKALESLNRLKSKYEVVVMEGAGSCAEINLREKDFVNFKIAHAAEASVILVADIDRGGVFAQIIGTLNIIPEKDRRAVKGIIINRFRGDASLFDDGIQYIEEKTNLPVLGLVPFFYHIEIDSEDGMPIETIIDPKTGPVGNKINIACIRLPHISNFTDFNPLIREDTVNFHYLTKPRNLIGYDLLILPGSKNVRSDMQWLIDTGWVDAVIQYKETNGLILGICGGYQLLGLVIDDLEGIEGQPGQTKGLGLLDVETKLHPQKITTRTTGYWMGFENINIVGYEIHMGLTKPVGRGKPVMMLRSRNEIDVNITDGWQTDNEKVQGVYLHGLFDEPVFRKAYLSLLKPEIFNFYDEPSSVSLPEFREEQYDLLAKHFQKYADIKKILKS